MTISTTFGQVLSDGRQRVRVRRLVPGEPPVTLVNGFTGETLQNGGITFTADIFDDPFFFDLDAFNGTNGRTFCDGNEVDFFAGLNVSALVLEIPKSDIGSSYRVWAKTDLKGLQADRMGLPAINTVFIPSNPFEPTEANLKDAFNATRPRADRRIWSRELKDNFDLFYDDDSLVDALVDILLPDLLPIEESIPPGFEFLNGRQLADDVIDLELSLLTNGTVLSDCVDANDVPFSTIFPYLGSAN